MSNELVEARPFLLMDAEDEKQIIAEMRGDILKQYVYSYRDKSGRLVEGLSLAGINAVSIHMAEISRPMRVMEQHITEDNDFIKAIVKVARYSVQDDGTEVSLDSTYGAKRQAKYFAKGGKPDPFAFEKAISKAERNARKKLIPEKVIVELMKQYKKEGKVKTIEATDAEFEVQKDSLGKITEEQIDELKALALEIGYKKLDLDAYRRDAKLYHAQMKLFRKMKTLIAEVNVLREERIIGEKPIGFLKPYGISDWNELYRVVPQRLGEMIDELKELPLANKPEEVELPKRTKAEKIQAIKDKAKELGYKENSPEVIAMLTPYGVFNVSQLVSLDGKTLDKILREEFCEK